MHLDLRRSCQWGCTSQREAEDDVEGAIWFSLLLSGVVWRSLALSNVAWCFLVLIGFLSGALYPVGRPPERPTSQDAGQ